MRHGHRGLSTYGLNGQRQGDEHHAYAHSGHGTIYHLPIEIYDDDNEVQRATYTRIVEFPYLNIMLNRDLSTQQNIFV